MSYDQAFHIAELEERIKRLEWLLSFDEGSADPNFIREHRGNLKNEYPLWVKDK
jgi:hypothetical protein